jgi:hypothetical protein
MTKLFADPVLATAFLVMTPVTAVALLMVSRRFVGSQRKGLGSAPSSRWSGSAFYCTSADDHHPRSTGGLRVRREGGSRRIGW